jgi:FkbM family methyltransferase
VARRAIFTSSRDVFRFIWDHPANRNRRVRQLGKAVSFQLQARLLHRRAQAMVGETGKIWVDLHRSSASKALYANPPDWPEMLVWQRHLRHGDLFFDVGANVGTYTVLAASMGASVVAVEAAADTAQLLRENVTLNGFTDVRVIEAAAGAVAGSVRYSSGLDSVNRIDPTGPVEVEMVTLDSLIGDRHVAGLKLDVEGFELIVLEGASEALSEHRIALMQLEWNDTSMDALGTDRQSVAELLARYGYGLLAPNADGTLVPVSTRTGDDLQNLFAAPTGSYPP